MERYALETQSQSLPVDPGRDAGRHQWVANERARKTSVRKRVAFAREDGPEHMLALLVNVNPRVDSTLRL